MFKQDWVERQIEAIAKTFAAVLFGKERVTKAMEDYEQQKSETGLEEEMLKRVIKKYIEEKKFQEAEDMIYQLVELNNSGVNLEIALSFYNELNDLDDKSLKNAGFSRDKIETGILKLREFY